MRFSKIFIIFYLWSNELQAACQESSTERLSCRNMFYQNLPSFDNGLIHFKKELLRKGEELLQNEEFRDILSELQKSHPHPLEVGTQGKCLSLNGSQESQTATTTKMTLERAHLYIFVSFSLAEKALLNLAHEAKQFGATFVLRGFKEGSYRKTAQALQQIITKTAHGIAIDPELYTLFNITAVPTFVLTKPFQLFSRERSQPPLHDKLQGHVSVPYALEAFAKEGDLKEEARFLLKGGGGQ